ncbi:cation diffusion facilitator CzcD-associated flavoprotein CzcO [Aeromicrobium panaciterrae]|uniref:Cation diffusion facilitator CzcD-associated flavoprotein CzcO n=1 Tax=Aeromicrobium panaciterrae TaxID=363861 RepID=A0ABU1US02_9ACTN|nr:NAD(P)/FAD-dependent oxidoreductase [Aeromicrobium panaciterrae]MDR7087953.1 cation diffusion facilitator CzcD-associated flavoprotein CzcO [Aeromicrobium panaciterrae]
MIKKDIVIIGTGFSGMGAAMKLRDSGREDFVVLEKAHDVGGTWRDNTYPGCECDIPSHMYSFSYELNNDWSKSFSGQAEIWAYMRKVADEKGIRPYITFGVEVTGASWDDQRKVWTVKTNGEDYEARVVIAGVGGLHIPNVPEIKGADSFEGPKFHSAGWDHTVDLKDKKVVVIGTGASAIQFIPIIAQETGHLTVFQRTPAWVLPKKDKPTPEWRKKVFAKVPGATRAYRNALYWALEARAIGFNGHVKILPVAEKIVKRYLAKKIPDPELRAKLTPDYRLGCKRVLQSNTYYPTFLRDDVTLNTDGVAEIVNDGVIDANGVKHEADIIIYGTGFHVIDAFDYLDVKGKDGVNLADQFREHGTETYMGMTIHGFPNLYFMLGPNTALGHNSVVFMIEQQTKYIVKMLDEMDKRGAVSANATLPAQTEFNKEIQKLVEKGIWTQGGCTSWYLDSHGKNRTIWPKFTFQYWWETRKVEAKDFEWEKAA